MNVILTVNVFIYLFYRFQCASEYDPYKSTLRKIHSAVGYKKELKVNVRDGKKMVS